MRAATSSRSLPPVETRSETESPCRYDSRPGRVGIPLYPETASTLAPADGASADAIEICFQELIDGQRNFWTVLPDVSEDLRALIILALRATGGSYRMAADLFHVNRNDYGRFMDSLRRKRCIVDFRPFRN